MNRERKSGPAQPGRRIFLKSLLAGSAFVLLQQVGGERLSRVLAAAGHPTSDLPRFQPRHEPGQGFAQSVSAGDPTSTGAVLWTRVDPSILRGMAADRVDPALVQWLDAGSSAPSDEVRGAIEKGEFVLLEVALTPDFKETVLSGYTPVWKDFDNVVKVDVDGKLDARSLYYYRFVTRTGHVSPTGRFKTLAGAGAALTAARFAYVSCQDYTNGYYTALRYAAEEEVDFVVHLGDYIYESVGDPNYQNPLPDRTIQLPGGKSKAFSQDDYRTLYRTYKSDPDLRLLHENHAVISIWDDHEFANDTYYPATAPDDNPQSDPPRRQIANQVWFEYTPARVSFDQSRGFKDSLRIYRTVRVGDLCELVLTDQRLYRSAHPCGEETLDRYFAQGCPKMNDPKQTMLGAGITGQRDWFLDRMKRSDALWKIWGNEVQFTPLKLLRRYLNLDAWDGFSGEREAITRELKAAGIKNFITITGDLHTFEAGLIKEDYQKDPDDAAVGVEFMVGSVTSSNLKELVEQATVNRVSPSNPIPLGAMEAITTQILGPAQPLPQALTGKVWDEIGRVIHAENPWIKLFNSSTHGYCVMELTRGKATWTAYRIDDIQSKDGEKQLLFQCEVPQGEAHIRILNK